VLSRLGQLLRVSLDKEQRDQVMLERELDHVGNYLGIEAERFSDRLQIAYDVPGELNHALVPSMVLQPLVENAIKHGPDTVSDQVTIAVKASRENGHLTLTVSDDGRGCRDVDQAIAQGGIGLQNVRERLRLLYGERATMSVRSPGGRGFIVDLTFPYETRNGHETHPDHHRGR